MQRTKCRHQEKEKVIIRPFFSPQIEEPLQGAMRGRSFSGEKNSETRVITYLCVYICFL